MKPTRLRFLVLSLMLLATLGPVRGNTDYKKWLNEEVVWIISEQEREAFKDLKEDAAREAFAVQFWRRRDPTPSTEQNEYKEEHYRRLIFASKAFQEGIPGWKSDRGRIYILHGPPDEEYFRESRSQISPLREVPLSERTPRTIVWQYHHSPNAKYYQGELTLVFQPSSGLSRQSFVLGESATAQQKADEMARQFFPAMDTNRLESDVRYRLVMAGPPTMVNSRGLDLPTSGMTEFARYVEDLFRSPGELIEERERERQRQAEARKELAQSVDTAIWYEDIPFELVSRTYFRPETEWLIYLELQMAESAISDSRLDIYAVLMDHQGERFDEFLDTVDWSNFTPGKSTRQSLAYTNSFSAPSGSYTCKVVVREVGSRKSGYREQPIELVSGSPEKIRFGSVLLTDRVEVVPQAEAESGTGSSVIWDGGRGIVYNNARLFPSPTLRFREGSHLFLYAQIWVPEDTRDLSISAHLIRDDEMAGRLTTKKMSHAAGSGACLEYGTVILLGDLGPGEYTLQIQALDHTAKTFTIQRTPFHLVGPESEN